VRARIKTLPGQQWATGRAYSEIVKEVFDERDIEIPFPHRTLYMGVGKDGTAPPLTLRNETVAGRNPGAGSEEPRRSGHGGPLSGEPPPDLAPPDPELTPPAPEDV
jgi:moderate conductance mechanosensitive channel